jgi:hypothetical protein
MCPALTCTFDASASSDTDGTITSYAWSFGDGTTGSGVTASHTYAVGGHFCGELDRQRQRRSGRRPRRDCDGQSVEDAHR